MAAQPRQTGTSSENTCNAFKRGTNLNLNVSRINGTAFALAPARKARPQAHERETGEVRAQKKLELQSQGNREGVTLTRSPYPSANQ